MNSQKDVQKGPSSKAAGALARGAYTRVREHDKEARTKLADFFSILPEQITRYMQSHKAARARLALKKYLRLTPRNGRYTSNQLYERQTFITEFFSIGPSIPLPTKSSQGSINSKK